MYQLKQLERKHAELAEAIRKTPIEETVNRCSLLDEYWKLDAQIKATYQTGNVVVGDNNTATIKASPVVKPIKKTSTAAPVNTGGTAKAYHQDRINRSLDALEEEAAALDSGVVYADAIHAEKERQRELLNSRYTPEVQRQVDRINRRAAAENKIRMELNDTKRYAASDEKILQYIFDLHMDCDSVKEMAAKITGDIAEVIENSDSDALGEHYLLLNWGGSRLNIWGDNVRRFKGCCALNKEVTQSLTEAGIITKKRYMGKHLAQAMFDAARTVLYALAERRLAGQY